MVRLTRKDFERESLVLSSAFSSAASEIGISSSLNEREDISLLNNWNVEGVGMGSKECVDDSHGVIYLLHPPIIRSMKQMGNEKENARHKNSALTDEANNDDDDDDFDETLSDLATAHAVESSNGPRWAEWCLSIAYSDTWGVPVLYFRCQNLDGTNLTRTQVLHAVGSTLDDSRSWDFISEEEHPITGCPSYFLHPCQTSERLGLLLGAGAGADQQEGTFPGLPPGGLLLSWLSLVLPAVGITIQANHFSLLKKKCVEAHGK